MNIHQLSANIDSKLLQLEQQLIQLQRQLKQNDGDTRQLTQDIAALETLKSKLKKSRDLAWRAHELQHDNNKQLQQKRIIGLGLCIFCGLGLLAIGILVLLR
ncbi:MAG: hypothetical protein V4660_10835 [Pseudomonadota bacterium]